MKRLLTVILLLLALALMAAAQPAIFQPSSNTLPNGVVNQNYSYQFQATGGTTPYFWYLFSGSLPPGFNINQTTGFLTGTPTVSFTYSFTIAVKDANNLVNTKSVQLTFNNTGGGLTITSPSSSLPSGVAGTSYSQQFLATGGSGNYTWSYSGFNIPGLGFSVNGFLSGVPTTPAVYNFTIGVTDTQNAGLFTSQNFQLVINSSGSGGLTITNSNPIANGVVNVPYNYQFNASGGSGSYSWSYSGNTVPGVGFTSSGLLSGTPTISNVYVFTITVQDTQTLQTTNRQFQITVSATGSGGAVSITSLSPLPNAAVGVNYSYTFNASGGSGSYLWNADTLPPNGLTLESTGLLHGTPTGPVQSNYTFYVRVRDSQNTLTTTASPFTINVGTGSSSGGSVVISTTAVPGGAQGVFYSFQFTATGCSICSWGIPTGSGSLPPGLSLSAPGILSGTPTQLGTFVFTVQATDTSFSTFSTAYDQRTFSINIASGRLTILDQSLTFGVQGSPYTFTLHASGGSPNYSWSLGSTDVQGLSITTNSTDSSIATISGTPTNQGNFIVPVTVTDATSAIYTFRYSLFIAAPLAIQTASLPNGQIGSNYNQTLSPGGGQGPYTWSVPSGSLPPGLVLDPNSGRLSGSPTQNGQFSFTVQLTDAGARQVSKAFSIVVGVPLQITTTSLTDGAVNVAYAATLSSTGGQTPISWSLATGSTLPPGLTLSAQGVISGSPGSSGSYTFTVIATDTTGGTDRKTLTLNVANPLIISTTNAADGVRGTVYAQAFGASGGTAPYTWSQLSGTIPPGLTLNPTSALLAGTPTQSGTFSFTLQVRDSLGQTVSKAFTITIIDPLAISTGNLTGSLGAPFSQTLAATGGTAPYTWSSTGLPGGLSLNSTSGAITGTPSAAGTTSVTFTVTDSARRTATQTIAIVVNAPPTPSIGGLPATSLPGRQSTVSITIPSGYPSDITGVMTLAFASAAGRDDQSVRFSNGSRSVNYVIPAGSTTATFTNAPGLAVLTGTTAGTITVSTTATGGTSATTRINIDAGAPVLTSAQLQQATGSVNVIFSGYSLTGEVASCAFHFNAASGSTLQGSDFTVQMTAAFAAWYGNSASLATGTQFTATVPFTIANAAATTIVGVSVNCTNARGVSNTVSP